jgi:hypothetical protein
VGNYPHQSDFSQVADESDSAFRKHSKCDAALAPNPQDSGHRRDAGDTLCQLLGRGPSCRHNVLLSLPGREYVAYFPRGGTNDVNVIAGSYEVEWLHPETGRYYPQGSLELKDGSHEFVPPDQPNHDWVLHLRKGKQTDS